MIMSSACHLFRTAPTPQGQAARERIRSTLDCGAPYQR
jgi:hypothetical protein